MTTALTAVLWLVLVTHIQASSRLHRAAAPGGAPAVLRGHTLTDPEVAGKKTSEPGVSAKGEPTATKGATQHLVDFYVHLEKDTLVWDELAEDGTTMICERPRLTSLPTLRPTSATRARDSGGSGSGPFKEANLKRLETVGPARSLPPVGIPRTLIPHPEEPVPVANNEYIVTLTGREIDPADFPVGTAFVISTEAWETQCRFIAGPVVGVDEEDDTLFFEITAPAKSTTGKVTLTLKRISGSTVAPIVDVDVHHDYVPEAALSKKIVFDEEVLSVTSRDIFAADELNNISLPMSERFSFGYKKRVSLSNLGHMDINARVSAGITRFRFTRFWKLQFKWEQYLSASFDGGLHLNGDYRLTPRTGPIFRYWIPGLSFSVGISFIARVKAGAFVGINWIVEMDLNLRADIKFNMRYNRKEEVTAQLLPPRYNARKLPSSSSSGSASIDLMGSEHYARFTGFAGLRPQVGLGLEYKRWSFWSFRRKTTRIDGNVGANIGVEAFAGVQLPPFKPYTGSGGKLGTCDRCHALQGRLSVKGKKLSAQLVVNNRVRSEHVFVQNLFEVRLGTMCGLAVSCSALPKPSPTPTATPTPRPVFRTPRCGYCYRGSTCYPGYYCLQNRCRRRNSERCLSGCEHSLRNRFQRPCPLELS